MRPERTGIEWTTSASGLHVALDAKGRMLGSMFLGLLGWRATLAVAGCTWEVFASRKAAEKWILAGGEA